MEKSKLSNQRSERRLPPSPGVAHWLVIPHGNYCKFQTFLNLFENPTKSYKKFIPELSEKFFWPKYCHQGWLIIVCDEDDDPHFNNGDCFLWNPSSLEIVMLPSLNHFNQLDGYHIKDCLLSSPPWSSRTSIGGGDGIEGSSSSSNHSSSGSISSTSSSCSSDDDNVDDDDSMVYILYGGGGNPDFLIYCHPGEKEWGKHEFVDKIGRIESLFYYKSKLYVMCLCLELLEITIQYGSISINELITKNEDKLFKSERVGGSFDHRSHSYYMESFGEVFRIDRYFIERGDYAHSITRIIVSILDFSSLTWEEVKILKDYVFFISYFSDTQLSCLASDLGLSKGCVYFTLKCDLSLYKYDLEDESILLSLPCLDIPTPWISPRWLMIPTNSRLDNSRTTTDLMLGEDEDIEKVIKATESRTGTLDKDEDKKDTEQARLFIKLDDDIVWALSIFLHTLDYVHLRAVSKNTLLLGSRIRFSKGGWLLMSKCETLFFYNPFTKSTVRLPDLPNVNGFSYTGISFSSLPIASDCLVFAIDKELFRDQVGVFFIKRGDKDWSYDLYKNIYLPEKKNLDFELTLNNPVFYRGRFYCLDHNGTVGVFKYEHPNISWEILSMISPPNCGFIYNSFLVECEGQLISVLLGRLGNWVRVFRLNETKMVWSEFKHLGRHMLFLSSTSCISAIAPTSQMENKIYFPRLHNEGILYYSLDTGMYQSLGSGHSAKDYRGSKEKLHCSWIEPNWSEISDDHLDWLNI